MKVEIKHVFTSSTSRIPVPPIDKDNEKVVEVKNKFVKQVEAIVCPNKHLPADVSADMIYENETGIFHLTNIIACCPDYIDKVHKLRQTFEKENIVPGL